MIKFLMLEKVADTLIGGKIVKGISYGECKRVSIGYELMFDPTVLLLDEPTSGLDNYTDFFIIYLLSELAHKKKKTIILTIRHPNSDIWELFDTVMLMVKGKFI